MICLKIYHAGKVPSFYLVNKLPCGLMHEKLLKIAMVIKTFHSYAWDFAFIKFWLF